MRRKRNELLLHAHSAGPRATGHAAREGANRAPGQGSKSVSARAGQHGRPRGTVSPGLGLAAVGMESPAHLTARFGVRMLRLLPAAAVKGSSPQRAEGDLRQAA